MDDSDSFDFSSLVSSALPDPAPKWSGFAPYNFVGGHNDPEGIPVDGLISSAEQVLRRRGRSLATYYQDAGPLGDRELRQYLADKLTQYRGIKSDADNILITSGSNHALTLLCNVLIEPGDVVIAEEHTYAGMLGRMRGAGATVRGCRLDEQGLNTEHLRELLEAERDNGVTPKFVFTIPTVQNPTSTVMPLERRRELLDITREFGVAVIEDECYADLLWDDTWPVSMRAMDRSDHVIHLGSFSKYLAPALRLGYVLAPWQLLSRLISLKNDGGTSALSQMVVADFLRNHYDEHVAMMNDRLKAKRDAVVEAVRENFGDAAKYENPPGGIYLWVKMPENVDTLVLSRIALEQGVAFNPGSEWSVDAERGKNHLRLCFANPDEKTIREGVARLARICATEYGTPALKDAD